MPTPPDKQQSWSAALAIGVGAVLIVVLVPLMQWLDRGVIANDLETTAPNPLGIGLLVGFVAINALVLVLARLRLCQARTLVVLYVMLSVALPFCSVGLVSPLIGSMQSAAREVVWRQEPGGMLHIYEWQDDAYFPKLTPEQFDYYMRLRDRDFVARQGIVDPKAESLETVRTLRQFWDGMYVTPETKAAYMAPDAGTLDNIGRAWDDIDWRAWCGPLLHWGGFAGLAFLSTMLLTQLLFRDWTQRENLPFPVAQLPLSLIMAGSGDALAERRKLVNPFFFGGLAVAVLMLFLSGLAHYQIVDLPSAGAVTFQRIDFNAIFVREPFSTMKNNYLFLSPLLIGVALMVHQDILRGCLWVFLMLQLLRLITGIVEPSLSESLGTAWHGNKWPYYPELGTGASVVFAGVLLWRSRQAFMFRRAQIGPDAFGTTSADIGNYLPGRWAGVGLALVVFAMAVFWYRLGMTGIGGLFVLALVVVWVIIVPVAFARARTEGGLAASGTVPVNNKMLVSAVGFGTHLDPANVKAMAHGEWLTVAALPGVLAAQIEGLYLAAKLKIRAAVLAWATGVTFLVGLVMALLSYMVLAYWYGGLNNDQRFYSGMVISMWQMGGDLVYRQADVDWLWWAVVLLGAVAMGALLILRKRYPRFPLPPICLVIVCLGTVAFQTGLNDLHPVYSAGPYVNFIWGPMLVAWIVKRLVLRFGGMDMYVRAMPAALGLICGQCLMIVAWSVYHLVVRPENVGIFTGVFY